MDELESFSKKHPRQTMVAGSGTSIFLIVLIMMGIYIAFDGKIPNVNLPVSFPAAVNNNPTTISYPVEVETETISYPTPASFALPVSYL